MSDYRVPTLVGFLLSQRLLALLVEKGVLSNETVIAMLDDLMQEIAKNNDPVEKGSE